MTRERSPSYPSFSLEESISACEKLFSQGGRSPMKRELIAEIIGYASLNGSAARQIAALNAYDLIEKASASNYTVSNLCLRIIRKTSDSDRIDALKQAAYSPPIFSFIRIEYGDCSESVLASQLLHQRFTDDGARKAASIFHKNQSFIQQHEGSQDDPTENAPSSPPDSNQESLTTPTSPESKQANTHTKQRNLPHKSILAEYNIPLGSNEVTLTFLGSKLLPEDFDELCDYVQLFKKQYIRSVTSPKSTDHNSD